MHITDTEGRDAQTFLAETFEFETCEECGGDVEDHDAIPIVLGDYGGPLFWARCKHSPEEKNMPRDRCTFINGIATIFWASAWADHCEETGCYNLSGCKIEEHMPEVPEIAYRAAHRVLGRIEERVGLNVASLFAKAWQADGHDPENVDYHGDLAERFGECLAYAAMGAGVSWEDDHAPFPELTDADLYGCEDAGGVSVDLQEHAARHCQHCKHSPEEDPCATSS